MNTIFTLFLLNIFSISFPMLLYMIFYAFKEHFKEGEDAAAFEIVLFISIFICYYFISLHKVYANLFALTIPLLLSFSFNKTKTSFLICIVMILLIYELGYFSPWFLIVLPFYYFVYYLYYTSTKSKNFLTHSFCLITCIMIILYYYFNKVFSYYLIEIVLTYILSLYVTIILINKASNVIKIYNTLKEIEDDKRLKTTIFKVTHEIKNPLAVIKGYLSLFDLNNKEKCERYIGILKTEVDNSLMVLKDFSEINHLSIHKEEIDFNKLLFEIKETVFPFFNDKHINYSFKSEENIIISADYNRLKQVIINLIKNAIEACDINGVIELNSYKSGKNLLLSIRDNGCGMDKDTLENLFTPFYSKKQYGTGLGLCLSKEIIESHGGSIKYSSSIGKNTTVKIVLPI